MTHVSSLRRKLISLQHCTGVFQYQLLYRPHFAITLHELNPVLRICHSYTGDAQLRSVRSHDLYL